MVLFHLVGGIAKQMREESGMIWADVARRTPEDDMAEHLLAWAKCEFIPLFTSRNAKVFEGCSFRPDFVWDIPGICVILECDIYAHANYNKQQELERMHELIEASRIAYEPTFFIRFNPSQPRSTPQLKFSMLLSVLVNVFGKRQESVELGKSVIYLFYPERANIWYPFGTSSGDRLLINKRPRPADTTDGNATACSDASPTQT